jgi:hypothetical protein
MNKTEFLKFINQEPPNYALRNIEGSEARYIPIGELESMLDWFNFSTGNFQYQVFKDNYSGLSVMASIELVIFYKEDNGVLIRRSFVGACNFQISAISPNQHFLATAKSECIKNAASDIGTYFGRGLNDGISQVEITPNIEPKKSKKSKPDSKILEQFFKAVKDNDEKTITMLTNIYEIKTED